MTAPAGFSNVSAIDRRLWIARGKDRRHITVSGVTIDTRCRFVSTLYSLSVKTAIVGCVRVRMKFGATQVWQGFTWRVTALALKIW